MTDDRSLYIVFEGIDGAGKSSQIARLTERLVARGETPVRTFEPTRGPHGSEIRRRAAEGPPMTAAEELALFVADRRDHVRDVVAPALARGDVLLQDRSFYSTAAYQSARGAGAESAPSIAEVLAANAFAPRPDLVVLLDLPAAEALRRVTGRGPADAFEDLDRLRAVREAFLSLADERFRVFDATLPPDRLADRIAAAALPLLDQRRSLP